jgi:probable phosphoglycerate mutase
MNAPDEGAQTVWMVRHGESTWNVLGLIQGHAEGPTLTEKGRQQSATVAEQFRTGGVGAIYSSDLTRAQQTAAFIGAALGLPVESDRRLRERCFGSYEGLPLRALNSAQSGLRGEQVVDASARPNGGESLDEVYQRAADFLEELQGRHVTGDVIVVTHGGTLRALRAYCAGVPMKGSEWDAVSNGSVWRIQPPVLTSLPRRH